MSFLSGFLAFVAGMIMAIQGSINSGLGKLLGLLRATLVVHILGAALALLLVVLPFFKESAERSLWDVPWYLYLGGVLSVAIIYLVAASIPKLGVAVATTLIIVGQVGTALAIDQMGLFGLERVPFTWLKGLGVVLLAAGAGLLLRK